MNPVAVLAEQLRHDHDCISVVVPAYNEDASIIDCVNRVVQTMTALRCPFEVVVVDDGSWDDTYHLVEQLRYDAASLKVLKNHRNEGKAAALKKGIAEANGNIVVTMDGDGQHLPSEIPRLIAPIVKGEADVVIGSRFLDGGADTPYRHALANALVARSFNRLFGSRFADVLFGFRAFRRDAIDAMELKTDRYLIEIEILKEALKRGLRVREVPATCRYAVKSSLGRGVRMTAKLLAGLLSMKVTELLTAG